MGDLKEIPAYDLDALVPNEIVKRAGVDPAHVDEAILGQSCQSR
jgi:acetyl-CoA C-acetyltransferase